MVRNIIFYFTAFALISIIVTSCRKDPGDMENDTDYDLGTTIILDPAEGSVAEMGINTRGKWKVVASQDWYSLSKMEGEGHSFVQITANNENSGSQEQEGFIDLEIVNDEGESTLRYYVIQRSFSEFSFDRTEYVVSYSENDMLVPYYSKDKLKVQYLPEWVEIINTDIQDQKVLIDGKTVSEYRRYDNVIVVNPNDSETSRSDKIIFLDSGSGKIMEVTVRQLGRGEVDYVAPFYRRSLAVKFTATWCSFCYRMNDAIHYAMLERPDRLVPMVIHPDDSEGGLHWEGCVLLENYYNTGHVYPVGIVNNICELPNYDIQQTADIAVALIDNAITEYPAKTNISAESSMNEDKLELNVKIAVKEPDDYKISVFILESGIIYPQANAADDYSHDYIVRGKITATTGDSVKEVSAESIKEIKLTGDIPKTVNNQENAFLLIYITYPGKYIQESIDGAIYHDYRTIVDNVITLPLNGSADFKYE